MNTIKLSVVITTYNMAKFIKRSLDSVLMQKTDFSFEVIISDDCSTDETVAVLESYKEKLGTRLIILQSFSNGGVIENYKRALRTTNGKYIAILDADDYWISENKLQKQFNILETYDQFDFVYSNFKYFDEDGNQGGTGIKNGFTPPLKNDFVPYLLAPYISPSCICFKRDLIDYSNYEYLTQGLSVSQDYALFLDFTSKGMGYYLNEVTMHYTVRSGSLSRKINYIDKIQTFSEAFKIANRFILLHPIARDVDARLLFNYNFKVLLASWESRSSAQVKYYTRELSLAKFLKFAPKAAYIYIASKNKILYKLVQPWVLRKRTPGK